MKCCINCLLILVLLAGKVSCSVVKLNDTAFASLPPLYELDEWDLCQEPGDVYCIVDAVLTGADTSSTLQVLQEYSKQHLKHYNRTLIHRGVCVTKCGAEERTWHESAQHCVNQSMLKYDVQAEVTSLQLCTEAGSTPDTASARGLAIFCIALIILVLLSTGIHAMGDKCARLGGNKYLQSFSLKKNWTILTYDRSKPRTDKRMKDIACVEGIRFLGMQCVIFSHVLLIFIYSYTNNPQFIEKMYDQFGWKAIFNSPLWLQAFFSISGFLTTYSIIICSETKPFTLFNCLMSIVNRYIRLTPLAAFALWFIIAWYPLLGSGPQWAWLVTREAQDCSERWWYHVLYVHNHLPLGKLCMGHTWYLAADMQLHVLGVFAILLFVRCRKTMIPILVVLTSVSALAAGLVVYWYQLTPIVTAQSPEELRSMFGGSQIMPLLYLPSWMNVAGYLGGVATAFILYHVQTNDIKLNEKKWFNVLFHLSLLLGGIVVLSGTVFLSDSPPARWASALYAAVDRTLVAICFNIFMLGCFTKCKSVLRELMSWRGFHTLGRLSYCAFLIHFILLRLMLASNTQLGHVSLFSLISLQITASIVTYIVSIPLCLMIELPAIQLYKAFTENIKTDLDRPLDLVAHVRPRDVV